MKSSGRQIRTKLHAISFVNINIEKLDIPPLGVLLMIVLLLVLLVLIYQSKTSLGFRLRNWFSLFRSLGNSNYKERARILFIDDNEMPHVKTLRDERWLVRAARDVQIDDQRVKDANIIFVDWKGVGKRISHEDEGIALVENIKRKYGHKKYVILYSAQEYKKPEGTCADDWLNKGAEFSAYVDKIQKASFALFS